MLSRCSGSRRRLVVLLATTGAGLALVAAGPTGSAGAAPTTCQGQPVTIVATASSSTVQGTEGPDVIDGAGRSSLTILGLGGDDVICSGPESPMAIHGGDGDDRIEMRVSPVQHAGDNTADGGAGDDQLVFVGDGYGEGRGGEGDDRFVDSTTSSGFITVTPGPGDDVIVGNLDSTHLVFGGTTGVRISVGDGRAEGEGYDTFSGIQAFVGTVASDTFVGSRGNDRFLGGPWTPRFAPSGAPDRASGGDGHDSLEVVGRAEGGKGGDRLRVYGPTAAAWGGPGDDSLRLFPGSTCTAACRLRADGGAGVDRMTLRPEGRQGVRIDLASGRASMGGRGRVALAGVENLIGTKHRDVLIGNARRNSFHGDHGDDVLHGRGGADALTGGRGRDLLVGGRGRDRAYGSSGRDRCRTEVRKGC
ncbi:hypothetical protein [Nocardioides lijunqiniae]|uniref:hypothetical protein n=1 Tax=Nocardioides lijunqiniae TaxID=2760832 RepID=UPI001877BEB9